MSDFEKWADEFRELYRPFKPDEYDIAKKAYLAGQSSAEAKIAELKYLLNRVLEVAVPYYDDGTPILNDEISNRINKVLS